MFSLRDEIGTCPNIEVEIEVTDRSPFFIRLFHAREEDKAILDKEMKRLCYLGVLKEGFTAYSSSAYEQKIDTREKSCDRFQAFKDENSREQSSISIAKEHFTILGNSKCEVMSVLDLKAAFHLLRLTENSKMYCGILPYFGSTSYLYQRMPMGLNISPSV